MFNEFKLPGARHQLSTSSLPCCESDSTTVTLLLLAEEDVEKEVKGEIIIEEKNIIEKEEEAPVQNLNVIDGYLDNKDKEDT